MSFFNHIKELTNKAIANSERLRKEKEDEESEKRRWKNLLEVEGYVQNIQEKLLFNAKLGNNSITYTVHIENVEDVKERFVSMGFSVEVALSNNIINNKDLIITW